MLVSRRCGYDKDIKYIRLQRIARIFNLSLPFTCDENITTSVWKRIVRQLMSNPANYQDDFDFDDIEDLPGCNRRLIGWNCLHNNTQLHYQRSGVLYHQVQ
jgi:hypothetical protein